MPGSTRSLQSSLHAPKTKRLPVEMPTLLPAEPPDRVSFDQVKAEATALRMAARKSARASAPVPVPTPEVELPPIAPTVAPQDYGKLSPADAEAQVRLAALRIKHRTKTGNIKIKEEIRASLPKLHPLQARIAASKAKRKVVATGRRVGKTTGAAHAASDAAIDGKRVLYASPSQEQADACWEKLKLWLDPFVRRGLIEKNETRRTMIFLFSGGRIRCKTASNADALRGDWGDLLILDECAMLEEKAWTEVGAPMLLDNDGDAWFLSTTRRRNWFFRLFQRAVADMASATENDTIPRWEKFHATSFDNPHLSEAALSEIMEDLTDEGYRQEIMAEFLEGEGAVFRNISACMTAPLHPDPMDHRSHVVVMGGDWGQVKDYTVFDVFCATCMQELHMDRFNKMEWQTARDRLVNTARTWFVDYILAEHNSFGGPNIEILHNEDGMPIEGFDTNMRSKGQIIRALVLCLERADASWQNIPVATGEMEAYEAITSTKSNHTSYSAPKDMHDDTVMARALALYAALTYQGHQQPQARAYSELQVQSGDEDLALEMPYLGAVSYSEIRQPYAATSELITPSRYNSRYIP